MSLSAGTRCAPGGARFKNGRHAARHVVCSYNRAKRTGESVGSFNNPEHFFQRPLGETPAGPGEGEDCPASRLSNIKKLRLIRSAPRGASGSSRRRR